MKTLRIINGIMCGVAVLLALYFNISNMPSGLTAVQLVAVAVICIGIPVTVWYVIDCSLKEIEDNE